LRVVSLLPGAEDSGMRLPMKRKVSSSVDSGVLGVSSESGGGAAIDLIIRRDRFQRVKWGLLGADSDILSCRIRKPESLRCVGPHSKHPTKWPKHYFARLVAAGHLVGGASFYSAQPSSISVILKEVLEGQLVFLADGC
jgi:hypothetical protein